MASTDAPIDDVLVERWSPRSFSDRDVDDPTLASLFEAARWAPSCFNEQPWRYIVGTRRERAQYDRVLSCLNDWNRAWAASAPVLAISVASLRFDRNGKPNRHAYHDVGLASMSLVVEAGRRGLFVHQMGGFDIEKARKTFGIPEGFEPVAAIAIGHLGDPAELDEEYADDEVAERERRPIEETVFGARWGEPSSVVRG